MDIGEQGLEIMGEGEEFKLFFFFFGYVTF